MVDEKKELVAPDPNEIQKKKRIKERKLKISNSFIEKLQNSPPRYQKTKAGDGLQPEGEIAEHLLKMFETFGVVDDNLQWLFMIHSSTTVFNQYESHRKRNIVLAALHEIAPKNVLETMLAVQMIGTHNLAMDFMGRALIPEQSVEGVNDNVTRATKLTRTFAAQLEAFNRLRGKGQQNVTVKHVHINEGGQAIVGNVGHSPTGGRGKGES